MSPPGLVALDLTANSIKGSLPPEYANMKKLGWLLLSANQLDGCAQSIPMVLVCAAWARILLV